MNIAASPIFNAVFSRGIFRSKSFLPEDEFIDDVLIAHEFVDALMAKDIGGTIRVEYDIVLFAGILMVENVRVLCGQVNIITLNFEIVGLNESRFVSFNSDYIKDQTISESMLSFMDNMFEIPGSIFSFIKSDAYSDEGKLGRYVSVDIVIGFMRIMLKHLSDEFKEEHINYVCPLRAHPKRYYYLDKAKINTSLDALDGDVIAEILRHNYALRSIINTWMKKFGLSISVDKIEDQLYRLKVRHNELSLNIADVGFGISQVLPVIIQGFLSLNGSLTLIEQPEIHLHPKMQADLGDLFIDMVSVRDNAENINKKCLIIETHSEYLLRRLRRRISEGKILSEDVVIYLISPDNDKSGAIIKELPIKSKGDFEWPSDYYGGELLMDSVEFLKNQF